MSARIFVGSSTEGWEIANAIQENLEHHGFQVTVWDQDIFRLSENTLESLLKALDRFDFGVFVFSPDDVSYMKGQQERVVRDNVVFELGLFMGRLGKNRNFIIMPRGIRDFHLPTDFAGLTVAKYDPKRENLVAALGTACNKIWRAINLICLKDGAQVGIAFEQYVGIQEGNECVVIAHCDDASKFEGLGVLSPGGAIVKELRESPAQIIAERVWVEKNSPVEWHKYKNKSTFFIVDSPYNNPYTRWIMKHCQIYLAGCAVQFSENCTTDGLEEKIIIGDMVFWSDKNSDMDLFDKFRDYFLIMRLPGIFPNVSRSETDITEVDKDKLIWVVAGIHSKASYAGVRMFTPENLEKFVSGLPAEYRNQLPEYFEAVYELPRTSEIIKDFSKLSLVHVRRLPIKSEIGVENGIPAGVARFFLPNKQESLKDVPIHTVHLDLVAGCNYECPHCIEIEERGKRLFLSLNTINRIFCDLKESGCHYLNFYGGEPMLHPDFSTILRLATNMGFNILTVTNGSFLDREDIKRAIVQSAGQLSLRVSLDGNSWKTHAENHGLSLSNSVNDFAKIRDNIVELINSGVSVTVSLLLLDNCIAEIKQACQFWKERRATALCFRPVTKLHGKGLKLDYDVTVGNTIKELIEDYNGWVFTPIWFREFLSGKKPDYRKGYNKCYSGYYRFVISPYKGHGSNSNNGGLEETDKAWISLCSYRRYDKRYGCEYPRNLRDWSKNKRITKLEGIKPDAGDCDSIICCRNRHNEQVAEEIRLMQDSKVP